MNVEEKSKKVRNYFQSKGWSLDRWGHLKATVNKKERRLKFQKIVIRNEIKVGDIWILHRSYKITAVYAKLLKEGKLSHERKSD